MAGGGMAVVAQLSCMEPASARDLRSPARKSPKESDGSGFNMPRPQSVEIASLSEAKTIEQSEILAERFIASKPLKAYAKVCSKGSEKADGEPRRRKRKDDVHPLRRLVLNKVPFFTWIRACDCRSVRSDIIAGITVGVMVIPQSMSYAAIAGLPYINGMYSACIPTLVYAFFGQSRQLAVGPVAMVSLLVEAGLRGQLSQEDCPEWYAMGGEASGRAQYQVCPEQYVNLACLTAAVVGIMQVVGSILRLGFLVSFLGHPVTSGFTSGAAIIIGLSQLKYMLGYEIPKSQFIHDTVGNIIKGLGGFNYMSFILGSIFLLYLVVNKKLSQRYKRLKMLGPMGPLVSCLVGILMMFAIPQLSNDFHVKHVGKIPSGIMPMSLGAFRTGDIAKVLPTSLSSFLIGYMESIAIGKNLASKHGYDIDAGQEMLALGLSNVVGSLFSCYPVTGSFSRSAVNNSTGAMTQLSGLVTAIVMFATLMFLTPLFFYLPKFVLAAVVLNSVIPLVALGEAMHLWRVKRNDFLLWVVAFLGTLFLGVLEGILVAVSLSLIIVIYESVRPQLTILWRIPGTTIYRNMKQESSGSFIPNIFICRIGSSLYFANAQYVKDMLLAYVTDVEDVNLTEYLVLEMTPVISMDSTACHVIHDIVSDFRSRGIEVGFAMIGNRVDKTMGKAKLKDFIGEQWLFPNVHEAVVHCLRHQYAKNQMIECGTEGATDELDVTNINVGFSNEVGFSNDMHGEDTTVFITLSHDVPMIMSEVTAIFKKSQLNIIRAQIEPLVDDGAKHIYYLRSIKSGTKLSETEITLVRKELEELIRRHNKKDDCAIRVTETAAASSPKMDLDALSRCWTCSTSPHTERIAVLERELSVMRDRLHAQGEDSTRAMDSEGRGSSRSPRRHGRDEHRASPTAWQKASKKFCCYYIA